MKEQTIKVTLSNQLLEGKCDNMSVSAVKWHVEEITIKEFILKLKRGNAWCLGIFKNNHRNKEYWLKSQLIAFDVDKSDITMYDFISKLTLKPTFSYTTHSEGNEGKHNYRIIYVLDSSIESKETYAYVYRCFHDIAVMDLGLDDVDFHSNEISRLYYGNDGENFKSTYTGNIYNRLEVASLWNNLGFKSNPVESHESVKTNKTTRERNTDRSYENIDKEFFNFLRTRKVAFNEVVERYKDKYPIIDASGDKESDNLFYSKMNNCYSISWNYKDGKVIKLKDGDGRRKKLFNNAMLRRFMDNDMTLPRLIVNMCHDMKNILNDTNDIIDLKYIIRNCKSVMKNDLKKYEGFAKKRSKSYVVNKSYCERVGKSVKAVSNMARKQIKWEKISELYDITKKMTWNLKNLNENGLKVSDNTLRRYCKANGINTKGEVCNAKIQVKCKPSFIQYSLHKMTVAARLDSIKVKEPVVNTSTIVSVVSKQVSNKDDKHIKPIEMGIKQRFEAYNNECNNLFGTFNHFYFNSSGESELMQLYDYISSSDYSCKNIWLGMIKSSLTESISTAKSSA